MQDLIRNWMDQFGALVLLSMFVLLFVAETVFPLRQRVISRWGRMILNGLVAIPSFIALRLIFIPAVVWLAMKNESWEIGLSHLYTLPPWLEFVIVFVILDYTNYLWHVLLHRIPLLWRFHLVHHTDLDLDLLTAMRFHFGELFGSVIFRGLVVFLVGASPVQVLVYEIVFEAATQFHHSNIRLSFRLEKLLNFIIVTPRMHGLHHSVLKTETDSNYAVIFSWWDRLHRTMTKELNKDVVIGVPSYHNHAELTVGFLLQLPFKRIRRWEE